MFASAPARREFAWFTAGQCVSFFGDKLHGMALIGLVGAMAPQSSALVLAGLAALYTLPFLIVAPIAGVLVDRWNRKRTLIACDVLRAIVVASTPLAYAVFGAAALFPLVAAVFVLTLFFDVAKMAIIPDLVPPADLLAANAVSSLLSRAATLAGIVFGGMIVGLSLWRRLGVEGYTAAFYLDAVTFLVSVATLSALAARPTVRRTDDSPPTDARGAGWMVRALRRDAWQVVAVVRGDARVLFVMSTTALLGLIGGCMYIVVVVAVQTQTVWGTPGVGYVFGLMACGIVVGSAIVGQFGRRWQTERIILAGLVAMAGLLVLSARPFHFPLHGPLSVAGGLALGPLMIAQDTVLHQRLPDELRARIFAARDVVLNTTFGLAAAATGLGVTALSRLGFEDPFRPMLLAVAPLVLFGAGAGELFVRRRTVAS